MASSYTVWGAEEEEADSGWEVAAHVDGMPFWEGARSVPHAAELWAGEHYAAMGGLDTMQCFVRGLDGAVSRLDVDVELVCQAKSVEVDK